MYVYNIYALFTINSKLLMTKKAAQITNFLEHSLEICDVIGTCGELWQLNRE